MKTIRLKIFLLLWPIVCVFALPKKATAQQTDSTSVVIAKTITIHSKILNQDRKIYVYIPGIGWDKTYAGQAYPVLYLMDGDIQTALVASQIEYLANCPAMPPMIVVGISNYAYDRIHDLTPTHFEVINSGTVDPSFKTSGGGEQFLQFVKQEVMPYINEHYKTQPFSIFSGHSLGGLMTTYCLVNHPDYFNAYIAVSPAFWVDSNAEVKEVDAHLQPSQIKHKYFFMSDGNEGGFFRKPVLQIDSILKTRKSANLTYQYIAYPAETHNSEPVKAIYDGLRLIYPNWYNPTDTTALLIKRHHEDLSEAYGYKILPDEAMINDLGNYFMSTPSKLTDVIELFKLNVSYYPTSAKVYDSLGDAYAKKGDKVEAIKCYRKSLAITPKNVQSQKKLDRLLLK